MKEKGILLVILILLSCGPKTNMEDEKGLVYFSTLYPNGRLNMVGAKRLGKLHGKAFAFYENGEKWLEQNYEFGLQNGEQFEYRDGRLFSIENYKLGHRNGWAKYYNIETGNLISEGRFLNDNREGYWFEYYGKVVSAVYKYEKDSLTQVVYIDVDLSAERDSVPLPPK